MKNSTKTLALKPNNISAKFCKLILYSPDSYSRYSYTFKTLLTQCIFIKPTITRTTIPNIHLYLFKNKKLFILKLLIVIYV